MKSDSNRSHVNKSLHLGFKWLVQINSPFTRARTQSKNTIGFDRSLQYLSDDNGPYQLMLIYSKHSEWNLVYSAIHCKFLGVSGKLTISGISTGVARGQSATPDSKKMPKIGENQEKIRKNSGKIGKNQEETAKIRKFPSLCPSWQIGLATLLLTINGSIFMQYIVCNFRLKSINLNLQNMLNQHKTKHPLHTHTMQRKKKQF